GSLQKLFPPVWLRLCLYVTFGRQRAGLRASDRKRTASHNLQTPVRVALPERSTPASPIKTNVRGISSYGVIGILRRQVLGYTNEDKLVAPLVRGFTFTTLLR